MGNEWANVQRTKHQAPLAGRRNKPQQGDLEVSFSPCALSLLLLLILPASEPKNVIGKRPLFFRKSKRNRALPGTSAALGLQRLFSSPLVFLPGFQNQASSALPHTYPSVAGPSIFDFIV